jgi:hypothetical protein
MDIYLLSAKIWIVGHHLIFAHFFSQIFIPKVKNEFITSRPSRLHLNFGNVKGSSYVIKSWQH